MKHLKYFESIRSEYQKFGPNSYYKNFNKSYQNPHSGRVEKCLDWCLSKIEIKNFLDLGCGNGIVSEYLNKNGINDFEGCDPYFQEIYQSETGHKCHELSFEDISKNGLGNRYDSIICSYSLHLCPVSYFNNLLYNLSTSCNHLVVISPSKYPTISEYFELIDSNIIERTHIRIFKTLVVF